MYRYPNLDLNSPTKIATGHTCTDTSGPADQATIDKWEKKFAHLRGTPDTSIATPIAHEDGPNVRKVKAIRAARSGLK